MEITIKKSNYSREFVKLYLVEWIKSKVISSLDDKQLKVIDDHYGIKSKKIIIKAMNSLKIDEDYLTFTLHINNEIKWENQNLNTLINTITFGGLSCKGYNIIDRVFKYAAENIDYLYERWLNGA